MTIETKTRWQRDQDYDRGLFAGVLFGAGVVAVAVAVVFGMMKVFG